MNRSYISVLLVVAIMLLPVKSWANVNIFACEPEWQSLAQEIGKNHVTTFSATTAQQDPHYIKARPSLIAKIRKADLLICSGAELESGWLPLLLARANKNIQPGAVGNLMAADFVDTLQKAKVFDRALGDIHAQGNPHIHLNPHNILKIAVEIKNRLQKIDPDLAMQYQDNYNKFSKKWQQSITRWEKSARNIRGIKIIPHHKSFAYLFDWLKINELASLEVRPGIAATPGHLKDLLKLSRNNKVNSIILSPYDPTDASQWLSEKSGIKILTLPYTVGGNKTSKNLFELFDSTIKLLKNNNS